MPDSPTTLFEAAKTFWRAFVPLWVFPFVFVLSSLAGAAVGHPLLVFFVVTAPLFFWSFFRAGRLWLERRIRYRHVVVWIFIAPFIVWSVMLYVANAVIE